MFAPLYQKPESVMQSLGSTSRCASRLYSLTEEHSTPDSDRKDLAADTVVGIAAGHMVLVGLDMVIVSAGRMAFEIAEHMGQHWPGFGLGRMCLDQIGRSASWRSFLSSCPCPS